MNKKQTCTYHQTLMRRALYGILFVVLITGAIFPGTAQEDNTDDQQSPEEEQNAFLRAFQSKTPSFDGGGWGNTSLFALRLDRFDGPPSDPKLFLRLRVGHLPDRPYLRGALLRRLASLRVTSITDSNGQSLLGQNENERQWLHFQQTEKETTPTLDAVSIPLADGSRFRDIDQIQGTVQFRVPDGHRQSKVARSELPATLAAGTVKAKLTQREPENEQDPPTFRTEVREGLKDLLCIRGENEQNQPVHRKVEYFPPVVALEFDRDLVFRKEPARFVLYAATGWTERSVSFSLSPSSRTVSFSRNEVGEKQHINGATFWLEECRHDEENGKTTVKIQVKNGDERRLIDPQLQDADGNLLKVHRTGDSSRPNIIQLRADGPVDTVRFSYLTNLEMKKQDE